jgi:hypothetical protein
MDALIRFVPPRTPRTGEAPTLWEICQVANNYEKLIAAAESRGDLLGFVAGLAQSRIEGESQDDGTNRPPKSRTPS